MGIVCGLQSRVHDVGLVGSELLEIREKTGSGKSGLEQKVVLWIEWCDRGYGRKHSGK